MPLNVALQIDPPAGLNPATDSSLLLGREALARGHHVVYLKPESVSQTSDGQVLGEITPFRIFAPDATPSYELGEAQRAPLNQLDVILVRQDPPFDMGYISNSLMLERVIEDGTLVLNHPLSVRNNPEKLLPFRFPEYCPPTILSADMETIRAFHQTHGAIVIKPAYGYGGQGIFKIPASGENLDALLEAELTHSREPLIVQPFLPDVTAQEKRIILIDGKLAGAIGRIPAEGDIRANLRAGGTAVATELTQRQQDIAYDVGQFAANTGLMLVGVDVIGDYLIEINTTSPTTLMQLKELTGAAPEVDFWNAVEEVIAERDAAMGQVESLLGE